MHLFARTLVTAAVLLALVGCTAPSGPSAKNPPPAADGQGKDAPAANTQPPTSGSTPAPGPAPTGAAPVGNLPSMPVWPMPGPYFSGAAGPDRAYAYSPFPFKGQTVIPVNLPEGTLLISRQEDAVYLQGNGATRGGVTLLAQPKLLFRLPHSVGQQWNLSVDRDGSTISYDYQVTEIAAVDTPAGKVPTVVVSVTQNDRGVAGKPWTERWAPGYGLVELNGPGQAPYTAARLVQNKPPAFSGVGHPAPDMTALLVGTGQSRTIVSSDGQELGKIVAAGGQDTFGWQRIGDVDFAWCTSVISATAVGWTAYAFQGGKFQPVNWIWADKRLPQLPVAYSQRDGVTGARVQADGTIRYTSNGAAYLFRFNTQTLAFEGTPQN